MIVAKKALDVAEQAVEQNPPDIAASLNNIAEMYRTQGQYSQAEPLCTRSLGDREKALGPDHPNVAQSLNNLASLYRPHKANMQLGEPLYRRARPAIREKALGPDHPRSATGSGQINR